MSTDKKTNSTHFRGIEGGLGHTRLTEKAAEEDQYNPTQSLLQTPSLPAVFSGLQPKEVCGLRDAS